LNRLSGLCTPGASPTSIVLAIRLSRGSPVNRYRQASPLCRHLVVSR